MPTRIPGVAVEGRRPNDATPEVVWGIFDWGKQAFSLIGKRKHGKIPYLAGGIDD